MCWSIISIPWKGKSSLRCSRRHRPVRRANRIRENQRNKNAETQGAQRNTGYSFTLCNSVTSVFKSFAGAVQFATRVGRSLPISVKFKSQPHPRRPWRGLLPVGTWLSLVEHSLGVRGVGSSNLPVPTIFLEVAAGSFPQFAPRCPPSLCFAFCTNKGTFIRPAALAESWKHAPQSPSVSFRE